MYFRQLLHEDKSCLSYLVGCSSKGVCATIDAQGQAGTYLDMAKRAGLKIIAVIETHIQADHVSCSQTLAKETTAPLYFGPQTSVQYAHTDLKDGDIVEIGNRKLKTIHTPGHTPEHICLLVDNWFLLTGDTLFVGDVGRVDLATQDLDQTELEVRAGQLFESLLRFKELPDYVEIYPGHYAGSVCGKGMDGKPISTLGWERRHNSMLSLDKSAFIQAVLQNQPVPPTDFQKIKQVNTRFR